MLYTLYTARLSYTACALCTPALCKLEGPVLPASCCSNNFTGSEAEWLCELQSYYQSLQLEGSVLLRCEPSVSADTSEFGDPHVAGPVSKVQPAASISERPWIVSRRAIWEYGQHQFLC